MSLSKRGIPSDGTKLSNRSKATSLNPNAAAFVPFSLRSSSGSSVVDAAPKPHATASFGKAVLGRSESSVSNNSDDEAQKYWHHQLPDDITPDFKIFGEDDSQGPGNLTLSELSLNDGGETSRFSMGSGYLLNEREVLSPMHINGNSFAEKLRHSVSPYGEDSLHLNFLHSPSEPWETQIVSSDQTLNRDAQPYNGASRQGFVNDVLNEHAVVDNTNLNPVEFLASQFPGFAAESLAEVYFTSGCDLSLTIEMLTQLEAPQTSAMWKDNRNRSSDMSTGSSRSSYVLESSYSSANWSGIYNDKLQSRSSARAAPVWLEMGDAVANLYSEMREEARGYARARNVYFEQATQAYLIGNKALAKELSVKGRQHNMRMKEAHKKAQESIYRQRNPVGLELQGNGRGQEKLIDLHGLHVSEAIHVLKHELRVLRSIARSVEQRLNVYVCVGMGHHTRGSRTPARLPAAVEHYLLEEEGLEYTEPQPGLLLVVIY